MKKRIIVISLIIVIVLALVLFLPVPNGTLNDGGTCEYAALTYKIVAWNRFFTEVDENGQEMSDTVYHKTSVYWYPYNRKSIDELWQLEIADN